MLGRNAARPFGMTPSRLVAAYSTAASHRVAHWILSKPYAMVHMQRYLFNNANHLLTSAPTSPSGIVTPTLVSLDSCSLHTSAAQPAPSPSLPTLTPSPSPSAFSPAVSVATAAAAAAAVQTAAVPFPDEIYYPFPGENKGYLNTGAEDIAGASKDITSTTVQSVASKNAVAFNYLLAASWHPKSRSRTKEQQQTPLGSAINNCEKGLGNGHTLRFADMRDRPFPGKVDAGEDAFFHISTPSRVALGVADGVGGWSEVRCCYHCLAILFWLNFCIIFFISNHWDTDSSLSLHEA